MYDLTLSRDERRAIDWIGHRYSNGRDLYEILWLRCDHIPDDVEWDGDYAITFHLSESLAWQIAMNASEEDGDHDYNFPCFSDELTRKLQDFCLSIV